MIGKDAYGRLKFRTDLERSVREAEKTVMPSKELDAKISGVWVGLCRCANAAARTRSTENLDLGGSIIPGPNAGNPNG